VPPLGAPDPLRVRDRFTNGITAALFLPPTAPPAQEGGTWTGLAREVRVAPDRLTLTLDPRYRWRADRPVTAFDLERAWRAKLGGETASDLAFVARGPEGAPDPSAIRALDERTLEVRTRRQLRAVEALLAHANFGAVPAELDDQALAGPWWREWSYGPYRVVRWDDQGFRLEANPLFPGTVATPRWEGVFSLSGEHSLARFRLPGDERADWVVAPLPPGDVAGLERAFPGAVFREPSLCVFGFYARGVPVGLREALACGVDRESVALRLLGGGQRPAYGLGPPDFGRGDQAAFEARCAARDKLALGESPVPPLKALCNTEGGADRVCATLLEDARARAGLPSELTTTEWRTMLSLWREQTHDLMRYSLCGTPDPLSWLEPFSEGHAENWAGYDEEAFQAALDAAAGGDEAAVGRAFARLHADLPFVPVYQHALVMLVRPGTTGIRPSELGIHPLERIGIQ